MLLVSVTSVDKAPTVPVGVIPRDLQVLLEL